MKWVFDPCLICSALWVEKDPLCEPCWVKLRRRYRPFEEEPLEGRGYRLHYLFDWQPGDVWLARLLMGIKGGCPLKWLRPLARDFYFRETLHTISKGRNFDLVPAPSRKPLKDHAHCWAEALNEVCGGRVKPVLRHQPLTKKKAQKGLGLKQRESLRFTMKERPEKHFVFVDDVLTTGSTARAAGFALGKKRVTCWTLAYRHSLHSGRL